MNMTMKVIKKNKASKGIITIRASIELINKIDEIAKKNDVSRNQLIEKMLELMVNDKNLVVEV